MSDVIFTRCWVCSELKKIDLEKSEGQRLCAECKAEMDSREDYESDWEKDREDGLYDEL